MWPAAPSAERSRPPATGSSGPVPDDHGGQLAQGEADPVSERKPGRAGRNLPAAVAIGVVLGGIALVTLFTVKATFLAYMGASWRWGSGS